MNPTFAIESKQDHSPHGRSSLDFDLDKLSCLYNRPNIIADLSKNDANVNNRNGEINSKENSKANTTQN